MIARLVTMTFNKEQVPAFLEVFELFKPRIAHFEGCIDLKLIQNLENPSEISTLSQWESEDHLNRYRKSELFGEVWPLTKKMFARQPTAVSFAVISVSK